jgi:imidazolonepropionase-like amidohydrolase
VSAVNKVELPSKTMWVDGQRKFLMPSLADTHTHIGDHYSVREDTSSADNVAAVEDRCFCG